MNLIRSKGRKIGNIVQSREFSVLLGAAMKEESTERLERLENHLAHLERQFDELNQVVIEQAGTIKKLVAHQQRLAGTVENAELERIRSTDPKPPHYQ